MSEENIYETPNANLTEPEKEPELGWFLQTVTIILIAANTFVSFRLSLIRNPGEVAYAWGGSLVPFIFAAIIVGLFQIGKKFRNVRSRIKIFAWSLVFFLVLNVGQFLKLVGQIQNGNM